VTPGRTGSPNSVAPGPLDRDGAGMDRPWTIRRAELDDYAQIATLFEAVAAEGRWIGTELPIDHDRRRARFADGLTRPDEVASFVAVSDDTIVGNLGIELAPYGVAELGMLLADDWRGLGLGSALLEAAIAWSREVGAHKVGLQMWPHNESARGLYEKYGFVEEGRLVRHYRRNNGELWDAVVMGLALDEPGLD
jgi:RimJ/RimL family protein N-acetyltransferase